MAVFDISRFDNAEFGNDEINKLYELILNAIKASDKKAKKNKTYENQARDVLIAVTSIKNGCILVTEDKNLRKITAKYGGKSISFEEFKNIIQKEIRL